MSVVGPCCHSRLITSIFLAAGLDHRRNNPLQSNIPFSNDMSIPLSEEEIAEGYKRIVLIPELEQMMFVAGETGEPTSETTTLIEQIVHEQVIEMVYFFIIVPWRS